MRLKNNPYTVECPTCFSPRGMECSEIYTRTRTGYPKKMAHKVRRDKAQQLQKRTEG